MAEAAAETGVGAEQEQTELWEIKRVGHYENASEHVIEVLRESDYVFKEKLLAFVERPTPSVSMIDISDMSTELVQSLAVIAPYMTGAQVALTVAPNKAFAEDLVDEIIGRYVQSEKKHMTPIIRRFLPNVSSKLCSPALDVPRAQTLAPTSRDLFIVYPTHLKRFLESRHKETVSTVVIIDSHASAHRWTTAAPKVLEEYSTHAKVLLLTARPSEYDFPLL